ncbi:MAG: hypothetical protein H6741_19710 [Alphaproteobacteria bacterium]|nr:hypothetical protein [Alphaproteobacteria bacterium]MCB9794932.1 hypothetical protein [Alphaproteobacteria bacterium]
MLVSALLGTGTALCDEGGAPTPTAPTEAGPPDARAIAEYRRLSDQLDGLVEKQIWVGAERTYQQLIATGVAPSFRDLIAGAHTARQLGEIGLTYERLVAAARLEEDREVVEWLWTLDQEYGRVVLIVEAEGSAPLSPSAMPFAPDARRCIEVAQQHLGEAGRFEGMLPVGSYTFGEQRFTVSSGPVAVEIRVAAVPSEGRRWGRRTEESTEAPITPAPVTPAPAQVEPAAPAEPLPSQPEAPAELQESDEADALATE